LDLSVDKFIIEDDLSVLAARARISNSSYSSRPIGRSYPLGQFRKILANSETCPLCSLVVKSVTEPGIHTDGFSLEDLESKLKAHFEAECYANWEIDGRNSTNSRSVKGRTRRIHLRWYYKELEDLQLVHEKRLKDLYLVFVAPERYLRLNADGPNVWERDALFLGRRIIADEYNYVKMKSWLDLCVHQHDSKCDNEKGHEFREMIEQSYFGVVDVLDMCLKPLPYVKDVPEGRIPSVSCKI
jgi:hypothetical protein